MTSISEESLSARSPGNEEVNLLSLSVLGIELHHLQLVDVREIQSGLVTETARVRPNLGLQVQPVQLHLQLPVDAGHGKEHAVPEVPHDGVTDVTHGAGDAEGVQVRGGEDRAN